MKKLIALLLALVMVLGLAACGGSSKPADTADAPCIRQEGFEFFKVFQAHDGHAVVHAAVVAHIECGATLRVG